MEEKEFNLKKGLEQDIEDFLKEMIRLFKTFEKRLNKIIEKLK